MRPVGPRLAGSLLFLALLAFLPRLAAQDVSGKDVVSPSAYVSFEPVARGMSFQLAVVLKIRPGFHINAHEVSADYLIPTELRAEVPPADFRAEEVLYPKGTLQTFAFSKNKPLNVYTGTVTLRLPLAALPGAPLGPLALKMKVRYQACSTEICLPPVTQEVEAPVTIVRTRSEAKAAHPDLFGTP